MFNNIGSKIKRLAMVVTAIEMAVAITYGTMCFVSGSILTGVLIIVGGGLFAWISSFFIYGFGELIENTSKIAKSTSKNSDRYQDDLGVDDIEQDSYDDDEEDPNIANADECPNCFAKITAKTTTCKNCGYNIKR